MPAVTAASRRELSRLSLVVVLLFAGAALQFPRSGDARALQAASAVRVSQVFPGGGSSTAPYGCDFIELFNSSSDPVELVGWSVQQYNGGWNILDSGTIAIPASSYYLIAALPCTDNDRPAVPPPDSNRYVSLSLSSGQVALVRNAVKVTGPDDPDIADLVGYGSAKGYEGSGPAPALSSTTSAQRKGGGCQDTDDNKSDFEALYPSARNSTSPARACSDTAPAVTGATPADGEMNVALGANVTVVFSEPVAVSGDWFRIECDLGPDITPASATVSGGPTSFTIDPHSDLYADDACALSVVADRVQDLDAADPPDAMTADYRATFTTAPGACGDPTYIIGEIQGDASVSPAVGKTRTVEAVVVADFQGGEGLGGYYIEEETADQDVVPETSEALYVSDGSAPLLDVTGGHRVRLTGRVAEVEGQTSLTDLTRALECGPAEVPPPVTVALPVPAAAWWEQVEGMVVTFDDPLTVAGSDELASLGRLALVGGARPFAFTQEAAPDPAGYAAFQDDLARRTLLLDDASDKLYPDPIVHPPPGLSASNTARIGDRVAAPLRGVIDGRSDVYALQPTATPAFVADNPRTPPPAQASGNIRVAFLSVDDYFTPDDGIFGPGGAGSEAELQRQRDKLVAALSQLDASIIGVAQVENDGTGPGSALADLTAGLNAAAEDDPYALILGGDQWGGGETTVGLIYQVARATPVGAPALLGSGSFAQDGDSPLHALPMAQTFEDATWGERFTVVVNQWHDRAGCPTTGTNADQGDGQGCWSAARADAAGDLAAWLRTDPTGSGDPDFLILGELNAFPREDPIMALELDAYIDLIGRWMGGQATTMLWERASGYADHALAAAPLAAQTAGAAIWAINAEEPPALDYQTENKSAGQMTSLYAPDAYRASNRNPVVVDLSLLPDQSDLGGSYGTAWHTGQGVWRLGEDWGGADDGVTRGAGSWNDGRGEVTVSVSGPAGEYACLYAWLDYSDGDAQAGEADAPNGAWDDNEKVIDGLPLPPGDKQAVTFSLPTGVIDADAAYNMRFRLVPAASPALPDCAPAQSARAEAALAATGRADGGEVEDWVFSAGPLAVRLASFAARLLNDTTQVKWETVDEIDAVGFNLYRGPAPDGPWQRINAALIPAQSPGSTEGASYLWAYRRQSDTPWHRLEALEASGVSFGFGPALAEASEPNAVTLVAADAGSAGKGMFAAALACLVAAVLILAARRSRSEV